MSNLLILAAWAAAKIARDANWDNIEETRLVWSLASPHAREKIIEDIALRDPKLALELRQ